MTDIWVPGIDEVIETFDQYRKDKLAIDHLAEQLIKCAPRETIQYRQDVIRVAQEIPEMQRLLEKEEELRDQIAAACRDAGDIIESVYRMYNRLTDKLQQVVIRRYYLDGLTMPEVAKEVNYCVRKCWEIRSDAFRRISETLHACAR